MDGENELSDSEENVENENGNKRRSRDDYSHTLPSERSLKRYLEDANC